MTGLARWQRVIGLSDGSVAIRVDSYISTAKPKRKRLNRRKSGRKSLPENKIATLVGGDVLVNS
jgi:hypothetical protein